jgi:predicted alpha/beta hydrolase family esterase
MKNALILHGTDASPDANWFRWIGGFMANRGYQVWLPQLPNSISPNTETYNTFIIGNLDFKFTDETVLIGHSSGAVEILNLLQNLPDEITVGDVYIVSVFKDDLGWESLKGLFLEPFNYDLIKSKARSITVIHSDNDPYVPVVHATYIAEQLGARLLLVDGQGHFNLEQSSDYKEFPLLAQIIETTDIQQPSLLLNTFRGEPVKFIKTQNVKDGVDCDVYSYVNDISKDLGIIRIQQGSTTPKQRILKGEKTTEGFLYGSLSFTFSKDSSLQTTYDYSDNSYGTETILGIGDIMQWSAEADSLCYEICYPPYEDGRFEVLYE